MPVTTDDVRQFVARYAAVIEEHRRFLTKLDAAIGDADHGENLHRGMQAALTSAGSGDSPSDVLKGVSMALISKVGGAAGPLYGTAFLRASRAVEGEPELSAAEIVAAFEAAFEGIKQRGKSDRGQKTMLDAWGPALDAASESVAGGSDIRAMLRAAALAADQGKRDTVPLQALRGRASYLGERSKGHQDPGATSTALLFATLTGDDELIARAAEDASEKPPEEGPGVEGGTR